MTKAKFEYEFTASTNNIGVTVFLLIYDGTGRANRGAAATTGGGTAEIMHVVVRKGGGSFIQLIAAK